MSKPPIQMQGLNLAREIAEAQAAVVDAIAAAALAGDAVEEADAAAALAQAQVALAAAEAAEAAASAQAAEDLIVSDLGTTDGQTRALIQASGSQTAQALSASFAPAVGLPVANGTDDTDALQAVLTARAGRRIVGPAGQSYKISSPLVIGSGTTLDLTGCTVTLLANSESRMIQNAAYKGSGARDKAITIIGGTWDRGGNDGATATDTHSLVFHRVDGLNVRDLSFTSTLGKYAVLVGDVVGFAVSNITLNSYSDGVHIQGPASNGTVRNVYGTTGDDMVAITARDYPAYDLTIGGGNVTNVIVDGVFPNNSKSAGKILAGLGLTCSNIVYSNLLGTTQQHGIRIGDDTAQAETTGSTIDSVTVRDVRLTTSPGYSAVQLSPQYGRAITVDGVAVSSATTKAVAVVNQAGTTVNALTVRGIKSRALSTTNLVDIGASCTVDSLTVTDVDLVMVADKSTGSAINIGGTATRIQLSNVSVTGGQNFLNIPAGGSCSQIAMTNVYADMPYGVRHSGTSALQVMIQNVNTTASNGMVRGSGSTGCAVTLRGGGIRSTVSAAARSSTQTLRVVGPEFRADLSILAPAAGDIVYNTNAALSCGAGLCLSDGSQWKHLITGATYAIPFNGVAFSDAFATAGPLNGHVPEVGKAWTDTANVFTIDGSGAVSNAVAGTPLASFSAMGDTTMTGTLGLQQEATTLIARVIVKYADSSNYIRLMISGAGANPTVTLDKVIGGAATTLATLGTGLALPAAGTYASFPFTLSVVGATASLTMNGATVTGTLLASDVTALAPAQKIALVATRRLRVSPGLQVTVNGSYVA